MLRKEISNPLKVKMTLMVQQRKKSLLSLTKIRKLRSIMMMRASSSGRYRVVAVRKVTQTMTKERNLRTKTKKRLKTSKSQALNKPTLTLSLKNSSLARRLLS
jgi:pyruvate kinase